MLFLWTTNKFGKIWVDGDGLRQIISKRLPEGYYCREVTFIGDRDLLNIHINLPENEDMQEKLKLEKKFEDIFGRSGISTNFNWVHIAPQDNPRMTPVWTMPLFWAGLAAGLTALVYLGIKGILWSLFAAVIGYGISWIFVTEDGQKQVSALLKQFRR